jgi:spore germination protein YaaH
MEETEFFLSPTQFEGIIGYLPFWDHERGLETIKHNHEVFTEISPFWYTLEESGEIIPFPFSDGWYKDQSMISLLRQEEIKLTPTIANYQDGNWGTAVVSRIINDSELMRRHIDNIVNLVVSRGYDGIDIDYEALFAHDRDAFSDFIGELASALHAKEKSLSVVVYVKTFDPGYGSAQAYDYAALGRAADQVRLMVYNKHWTTSAPGPIAPIRWVERVASFAVQEIPREKIILGFGLYGIDWVDRRGREIEWREVVELVNAYDAEVLWDSASHSPWFEYTDPEGKSHTVWFENAFSIQHKLEVAQMHGVARVYFWRLGGEDPRVWQVVESEFVAPTAVGLFGVQVNEGQERHENSR